MRISDWSSDVCSSDLPSTTPNAEHASNRGCGSPTWACTRTRVGEPATTTLDAPSAATCTRSASRSIASPTIRHSLHQRCRSEEHTSELQSLMRISYAVFCLKKKRYRTEITNKHLVDNESILTQQHIYSTTSLTHT